MKTTTLSHSRLFFVVLLLMLPTVTFGTTTDWIQAYSVTPPSYVSASPPSDVSQVYNIAYGLTVTVEPPEATCGVNGTSYLFGYYQYCTVDTQTCAQGRQHPRTFTNRSITSPSVPVDIGGARCTVPTRPMDSFTNGSWCYLHTLFNMTEAGHSGFTIMMRLRPTNPHGNIMFTANPPLTVDFVSNQVYVRNVSDDLGVGDNVTSPDWQIPLGAWTHLTMQMYYDLYASPRAYVIHIFINGTLYPPAITVPFSSPSIRKKRETVQVPDLAHKKKQAHGSRKHVSNQGQLQGEGQNKAPEQHTRRRSKRATGGSRYQPPIQIAVGSVLRSSYSLYLDNTTEIYMPVPACRQVGYNSIVRVNATQNQTTLINQLSAVINDVTRCTSGDTNKWRRLTLYACAAYFPPPLSYGTPTSPCQSLCLEYNQCTGKPVTQIPTCSPLPTSYCIDEYYIPLYRQYVGEIKDFHYTEGIMTNREIKEEATGIFDTVTGNSDCLCSEDYPVEQPDSQSYCIDNDELVNTDWTATLNPTLIHGANRYNDLMNFYNYYNLTIPSYLTDMNAETFWAADTSVSDFSITIQFNGSKQVFAIDFIPVLNADPSSAQRVYYYFGAPLEGYIAISVVKLSGPHLVQYISNDCSKYLNMTPSNNNFSDSVVCYHYQSTSASSWRYMWISQLVPVLSGNLDDLQYWITGIGVRFDFHCESVPVALHSIVVGGKDATVDTSECVCYPPGTAAKNMYAYPRSACCQCLSTLLPKLTGPRCEPYITAFVPTYGPEAGGTDIFIFGALFGSINASQTVAFDGVVRFTVVDSNDTYIHCVTAPYTYDVGVAAFLGVGMTTGFSLNTPTAFQYRPNPVILTITPRTTFISGGIEQTVTGLYLDSVFVPVMTVTASYRGSVIGTFATNCAVINGTVMMCPSPDMNSLQLPPASGRRRRQDTRFINEVIANLEFYIGFKLDGFTKYKNLSDALPSQQTIDVSYDPIIKQFTEPDMLRWYSSPAQGNYISILGQRLNYGTNDTSQYAVTIGKEGVCVIVQLEEGQIVCQPPLQKPELGIVSVQGQPQVKVKVGNLNPVVGYLGYPISSQLPLILGLALGLGLGVILIVIIVVIYCKCCRHHSKDPEAGNGKSIAMGVTSHNFVPAETRAILQRHIIDRQRLEIGKEIGRGHFGNVYGGYLYKDTGEHHEDDGTKVAIKTLRDSSRSSVEEFLDEAIKMKDFAHPNVLMLSGVVVDNGSDLPLIVLPYMDNGDLKSFVANDPNEKLTDNRLTELCLDVANGMQYLGGFSYVHRDLAARNCLVDEGGVVKVADFGMAKDVYEDNYYKTSDKHRPQPIRWMAVETFESRKFSTKSDVWSFGVLTWEVMSRGKTPYMGIDNFDVMGYVTEGRRLEQPRGSSNFAYQLMLRCWSKDPDDRPTFSECVKYLTAYLADRNFTLPSNDKGEAGDYVGLRNADNKNVDEGGYLDLEGDDKYTSKDGYMLPSGNGRSDERHSNESRPYQNLGGATNSADYNNGGDANRRGLNVYERALKVSDTRDGDGHVYERSAADVEEI